jgi:micrococcal nuclease
MLHTQKKASQWGAFFVWLFVCLGLFLAPAAWAEECAADRIDTQAEVAWIADGDTVRLTNGQLVRFVGINTPEIGHNGKPSEPFAEEAKAELERLIGDQKTIGLRIDRELRDRYGRLLAHVYTADGRSVEAHLLRKGLGAQVVIPPNDWHLDCYRAAEAVARQQDLGVWKQFYRPIPVDKLPRDTRGFRVISGTIDRVGEGKYSLWLNFPRLEGEGPREGVALRIPRKDMKYFTKYDVRRLLGQKVVARGWMFRHKKQLVMVVSHPAALEISL